jgi:hypothetical protein
VKVFTTFLGMGLACLLIHRPALAQIEETSVAVNQPIPTAVVPRLIRVNGSMPEDVQKAIQRQHQLRFI